MKVAFLILLMIGTVACASAINRIHHTPDIPDDKKIEIETKMEIDIDDEKQHECKLKVDKYIWLTSTLIGLLISVLCAQCWNARVLLKLASGITGVILGICFAVKFDDEISDSICQECKNTCNMTAVRKFIDGS